ncbi:MAG: hypothetical protein QOF48_741 [Verrucomicrobiota bacterium]|jgi:hypothetical protein
MIRSSDRFVNSIGAQSTRLVEVSIRVTEIAGLPGNGTMFRAAAAGDGNTSGPELPVTKEKRITTRIGLFMA